MAVDQANRFGLILRVIALKDFLTETRADEIVEHDCSIRCEDGPERAGSSREAATEI